MALLSTLKGNKNALDSLGGSLLFVVVVVLWVG